jgi:hypothetical protein
MPMQRHKDTLPVKVNFLILAFKTDNKKVMVRNVNAHSQAHCQVAQANAIKPKPAKELVCFANAFCRH